MYSLKLKGCQATDMTIYTRKVTLIMQGEKTAKEGEIIYDITNVFNRQVYTKMQYKNAEWNTIKFLSWYTTNDFILTKRQSTNIYTFCHRNGLVWFKFGTYHILKTQRKKNQKLDIFSMKQQNYCLMI